MIAQGKYIPLILLIILPVAFFFLLNLIRDITIVSALSSTTARPQIQSVACNKNSYVLAIFGQSNSANSVSRERLFDMSRNPQFQVYDWVTRKCYPLKEPLPGAQGVLGNSITDTAIKLNSITGKPVTVVPFGFMGASIFRWAYGDLELVYERALKNMRSDNIKPDIFLWHQGEAEADIVKYDQNINLWARHLARNTRTQNYAAALEYIINESRIYFPRSHFGIALSTICKNIKTPEPVIRKAQAGVARSVASSFVSADTDMLGLTTYRYDDCHFTQHGAGAISDMYTDSIMSNLPLK